MSELSGSTILCKLDLLSHRMCDFIPNLGIAIRPLMGSCTAATVLDCAFAETDAKARNDNVARCSALPVRSCGLSGLYGFEFERIGRMEPVIERHVYLGGICSLLICVLPVMQRRRR